jgi:hypothetical protein
MLAILTLTVLASRAMIIHCLYLVLPSLCDQ